MTDSAFDRRLRALDLTPKQLADTLGVARTTVWRWRHGRVKIPRYALAWLELHERERQARKDIEQLMRT